RARLAIVKRAQEWVLLGFGDALCVQPLANDPRQRALANSDGAFHCNVAGKLEKIRHGSQCRDERSIQRKSRAVQFHVFLSSPRRIHHTDAEALMHLRIKSLSHWRQGKTRLSWRSSMTQWPDDSTNS